MGEKTKESNLSRNNMDKVMHDLNMKKEAPLSAFILLLVLYTTATFFTIAASRTQGSITVFENQIAIASFAGAFSSLSNICVISATILSPSKTYCIVVPLDNVFFVLMPLQS